MNYFKDGGYYKANSKGLVERFGSDHPSSYSKCNLCGKTYGLPLLFGDHWFDNFGNIHCDDEEETITVVKLQKKIKA